VAFLSVGLLAFNAGIANAQHVNSGAAANNFPHATSAANYYPHETMYVTSSSQAVMNTAVSNMYNTWYSKAVTTGGPVEPIAMAPNV